MDERIEQAAREILLDYFDLEEALIGEVAAIISRHLKDGYIRVGETRERPAFYPALCA